MTSFAPPYLERPAAPLGQLALLRAVRRNILSIWHKNAFENEFFSTRLLRRLVFICNSPDTVAYALIEHNDSFERKSPQMRHALGPLLGDGLFISDGETWAKRRRIVASIVHASRLPAFAPIMIEAAGEAAERLAASRPGGSIDVLREMAMLTAEIICRTIFGRRLGAAHATAIVTAFSEYQAAVAQVDIPYLLGLPDWVPRFQSAATRRAAGRIHTVLDEIISQCREELAKGGDSIIRLLLEAADPDTGEALDEKALRNEVAVIFMAGHETTANALSWTWYLLSQAPEVEARLHAELAQVLGGRLPTHDHVMRLVFTRAIFEEAIRLYPPVPILGRQAVRDELLRGRRVPVGSLLLVVPWLLHRHRLFWERPDDFVPDRFLPENAAARVRHAYIPFAVGARICAGMAFALTEAIICIATLAQRFRLRLAPGAVIAPVCRLTLRPGDHLPMLIEPRH
jgi:cytochrome P450